MFIWIEPNYSKQICDVGALCFENGYGCYLQKRELIGFKKYHNNKNCPQNDLGRKNFSNSECAHWCINHKNCVGFILENSNFCQMKVKCSAFQPTANLEYYIRITDDRFSCFFGGLDNLPSKIYIHPQRETAKTNAITNNHALVITSVGLKIKVSFRLLYWPDRIFF